MSPFFLAAIEAAEEAVYNSLLKATPMTGAGSAVEALPIGQTVAILKRYGVIPASGPMPPGALAPSFSGSSPNR